MKKARKFILFAGPALFFFLFIIGASFVSGVQLSFTDWNGLADSYRFIGNTQFDYKVHGFEDLRLNLNLGIDWAKSDGVREVAQGSEFSFHDKTESGGGSHTDYDYTRRNTTLEFYADYNKTFAKKHNVDLMAGYSWQHFWNNNHTYQYRIADKFEMKNTEGKGELYLISFFGRSPSSAAPIMVSLTGIS